MECEYETVDKVIADFAYLTTRGNIGSAVATDIKRRIKVAYRREVAELERKAREANLKYRAEKARHTDTYKDARIKAQDDEITTLKREVAELRECLEQAYGDKTGTYTMKGNEVERWRKALCEKGETK